MDQLRVRCPACQKLYQVETEAIYSLTPHFECKACHSVFAFEFPPTDPSEVTAFLVNKAEPAAAEAPSLIFQAQPSLVQMWNSLFEDYADHERHEDFVKRCRELEALPFAKMKYQDLQSAMGSDPLCDKYLRQVEALMEVKTELGVQQPVEVDKFLVWFKAVVLQLSKNLSWKKILYWSPLLVSLMMVLLGFSNLGQRNMIGLGVMFGFSSYGLIRLFRGRIRLSDFID